MATGTRTAGRDREATWLLVALALALAAAGCPSDRDADGAEDAPVAAQPASGRHAPAPGLSELRLVDLTPAEVRPDGFDSERVVELLREAFYSPGGFTREPVDDPRACRAGVVVGYALVVNSEPVPRAEAGDARVVVEAELHCPRDDGLTPGSRRERAVDTFKIDLSDVRAFDKDDGASGVARLEVLIGDVARRAARALNGQARMRQASDADLLEALAEDEHPGVLAESASEAGERRLTAAVDHLVRLTDHDEELVAMRAGAALGLLGDRRDETLRALVRLTEGPSQARHLVAIHALGDIGGPGALRYLDNLAVGHPSPGMREIARQAAQRARAAATDDE